MASLYRVDKTNADGTKNTAKHGKWMIEYINPFTDGPRRPRIAFDRLTQNQAETIREHIQNLIAAASRRGALPPTTQAWVDSLAGTKLLERLAELGLVAVPKVQAPVKEKTLKEFIDEYIEEFSKGKKPATRTRYETCRSLLFEYFDKDMPLSQLTVGHARGFDHFLRNRKQSRRAIPKGLSESYVRRMCSMASQFLRFALDSELIEKNPFSSNMIKKSSPKSSPKRSISREDADKILQQLTDPQHRLFFVLMRFGGLRMPSEPRVLQWKDIEWKNGHPWKIHVTAEKTAHHDGGGQRIIPAFPEIARELLAVKGEREPQPNEPVLTCLQDKCDSIFRKPLIEAIEAAGVDKWEKLAITLRATRANELRDEGYRDALVNLWVGHSQKISQRHYATISDDDFDRATQIRQQQVDESGGMERKDAPQVRLDHADLPAMSVPCRTFPSIEVGDTGLEQRNATSCHTTTLDEDKIRRLIESADFAALEVLTAWKHLPTAVQNEILSIVRHALEVAKV